MDKLASLLPEVINIVRDKGTEPAGSGCLLEEAREGSYLCRRCGHALYRAHAKFYSGCGWPSFDDEIPAAISREPDADGRRTEILCAQCGAHLGHVFLGEKFTAKNTRHCVNSLAIDFCQDTSVYQTEEAIVAGGCFWGIDYYLKKAAGVVMTEVGYIGGHQPYPTYQAVCAGDTGHIEAVRIVFDTAKTGYTDILKLFFELHDPTQADGQGPDIGEQYLSRIFYYDETQKQIAEGLIQQLRQQGLEVQTVLQPVSTFWPAEDYHQAYYERKGTMPYCHQRVARF